ncbi:hypothetical protein SAMN04488689_110170 [Paenibacillus sp. cl6col]|nr:hypothetical protein PAAL66ix_15677 [Paenibacillus alvei A6-6i-x]SDG17654.1 hypothetical protein SAMN04488689_110170 [Paenibacillus sp. cl6col]
MQGMTLDMYLEPLLQNINIFHSYSSIDGRVEIGFGSGEKKTLCMLSLLARNRGCVHGKLNK